MEGMNKSRHIRVNSRPNADYVPVTPLRLDTLLAFNRYRILPANWLQAVVGCKSYGYFSNQLTYLWENGLLDRRTLNGKYNNHETMNYTRTEAGAKFLTDRGHAAEFDILPNASQHDYHQVLSDMAEAQFEIATKNTTIEYNSWLDIVSNSHRPLSLPDQPFKFLHGTTYTVPDGRPFYLKNLEKGHSVLFLKELDRSTEQPATVIQKIKNYAAIQHHILRRYRFRDVMVLFTTTNAKREENILKWIESVFPDGCSWMATNLIEDHIRLGKSTAPVTTSLFTQPWKMPHGHTFDMRDLEIYKGGQIVTAPTVSHSI